ncbi:MAG: hypothetical protein HWQ38_37710 [Nostoc sp. NMS7]|uniref:hypothetical protein n=1 Tax=Nostoc sp. NMS7 TaxID=2815391 RepID=UPI0025FA2B2C|nr:hypothetical protein [Nostoc sp. NMS7]MBN3951895.1 hypothetical protein [Nostoc sp. NMS7]
MLKSNNIANGLAFAERLLEKPVVGIAEVTNVIAEATNAIPEVTNAIYQYSIDAAIATVIS